MRSLVVRADGVSPFTGRFRHRLEQNRVTLPGRWRQAATSKIFAVVLWPLGLDQHLLALPPARWGKMVSQLKDKPLSDEEQAATERILGTSVNWSELDGAGRLPLTEHLVMQAGIGDEVEIIGRLDKFELWSPARYQQVMLEDRKIAASFLKKLEI